MVMAGEHRGSFHYYPCPTYTCHLNASGWGSLSAHHSWDRRWEPEGPQNSSEGPKTVYYSSGYRSSHTS